MALAQECGLNPGFNPEEPLSPASSAGRTSIPRNTTLLGPKGRRAPSSPQPEVPPGFRQQAGPRHDSRAATGAASLQIPTDAASTAKLSQSCGTRYIK